MVGSSRRVRFAKKGLNVKGGHGRFLEGDAGADMKETDACRLTHGNSRFGLSAVPGLEELIHPALPLKFKKLYVKPLNPVVIDDRVRLKARVEL